MFVSPGDRAGQGRGRKRYRDVSSSRARNTLYTNNTGAEIFVSVSFANDTGFNIVTLNVDGSRVNWVQDATAGGRLGLNGFVPAGSTYEINTPNTISSAIWLEYY
jgi:hypothetical protein